MRKELGQVRQKKKKLLEKKALIDEQLELLSLREEELENEEVIIVFREANITLEEVMEQFKQLKQEKKEKRTYEKRKKDSGALSDHYNASSICNEYSGRSGRKKQTVRCFVYA